MSREVALHLIIVIFVSILYTKSIPISIIYIKNINDTAFL
jgi:hypothetical protein